MLVFRTYFKILTKYKGIVILYTVILLCFAVFNMQTSDNSTNFTASRPDVYVENKDEEGALAGLLCDYIKEHAEVKGPEDLKDTEGVSDALFYRQVNYTVEIPENFSEDFLAGERPDIVVRSIGDYQAAYMEMQLERFLQTASLYQKAGMEEKQLIKQIKETLKETVEVELKSSVDKEGLSKGAFFYNFANYSLLAGCVYAIAVALSSFRRDCIRRRANVSPINNLRYNLQLLLANGVFAFALWAFYVLISFVMVKDVMFTKQGLLFIANSFVFALCALSVGFLIGNLTTNKEALGGIINVVALGSSFLCGAFVPVQWLPDAVLKIAHILPSYWYIQNNERIAKLETVEPAAIKPLLVNGAVVLGFAALFVAVTNVLAKRGRQRRV